MKFGAVVLAGGSGTRFGNEKKQFSLFHGKMLYEIVYEKAKPFVDNNIVVVGVDVSGGSTRSNSVINGLASLDNDTDRVIILEAARPMVTKDQVIQLLNDAHPSTSFVRPLVNTVVYRNGTYINREDLYDLLTPQAFDYKLLLEAYQSEKFTDVTDETRIMYEFHGIKPHFIETGSNLFKVTYPGDLDIVETIYQTLLAEGKM